jgi:mannosylglycoprotein endo-beta-mannosidase
MYAADAALFANPNRIELRHITEVLNLFDNCSKLRVNQNKMENFPIRCDETLVTEVITDFPGKIGIFPSKYLGLPLHTRKLRRADVQPLIDKIDGRILGWKGKLLSTAGRETLVKSVLTAQPIYHLMFFPVQKWLLQQIDKM